MNEPEPDLSLKDAVRRQAQKHALSADQLRALTSLSASPQRFDRRRRQILGAAAVAATVSTMSLAGWLWSRQLSPEENRRLLAAEIAHNHLQPKPLDAVGTTLKALRPVFASLGFRLADDPRLELVEGTLRGGRFCSVASVPAALLRYESERGHATVYQARFDPDRHYGVNERHPPEFDLCRARGVEVCLWRSQGLLFAFVTT